MSIVRNLTDKIIAESESGIKRAEFMELPGTGKLSCKKFKKKICLM